MNITVKEKNVQQVQDRYNPELDKYNGVSLFPEKVAKAKESIKKHGLPSQEMIDEARRKK